MRLKGITDKTANMLIVLGMAGGAIMGGTVQYQREQAVRSMEKAISTIDGIEKKWADGSAKEPARENITFGNTP